MGWLAIELAFLGLLVTSANLAGNMFFAIIAIVVLAYRWQNLISYWFHAHILSGRVSSPTRALILTVINFGEIVLIFCVLDFILSGAFNPSFVSILNSLDYSVGIMTTLGWDKYEPAGFGYLLFYAQVFSGIGTGAIVIGAVLSYFDRQT